MFRRLNRGSRLTFVGLLVGIAGLVVQWLAEPSKFAGAGGVFGLDFPPGILFVAACGLLTLVTARWWWHPVFAVLIGIWIVGLGAVAGKVQPNLVSPHPGTVAGTLIMAVGLILAVVAGIAGMIATLRTTRVRPAIADDAGARPTPTAP